MGSWLLVEATELLKSKYRYKSDIKSVNAQRCNESNLKIPKM